MKYTEEDIKKITENVSILDYFQYLTRQGKVNFDRKQGRDYYFRTEENKFSVNETGFYDFKTGNGGKLIKAVMSIENKSWKEAMDFLKDFSNIYTTEDIAEIKKSKETKSNANPPSITKIVPPNNDKLISYFNERGISKEILNAYTRQIHYQVGGKKYFGIGLENQSKGYEIRNPMMKTKLGKNDLTIINKSNGKNVFAFEGMTDMLSFLQLQKLNNKENKSTLVVLNSVVNVNKFVEIFKNYKGKINLLLDGDAAGTEATNQIISLMPQNNIEDLRSVYGIGQPNSEINDLNDYLKKRDIILQKENINKELLENDRNIEQSKGISTTESVGDEQTEPNHRELDQTSQSKHRDTNEDSKNLDSYDVGNGLSPSELKHLGRGRLQPNRKNRGTQSQSNGTSKTFQGEKLGSDKTNIPHRNQSQNQGDGETNLVRTGRTSILEFVKNLKDRKPTNEEISELVNVLTEVAEDKTIQLKKGIEATEDIKTIISQYKSGGIAKSGRGILDEYYTDERLVNTIGNLIRNNFRQGEKIDVLEPSVGIGNFLSALKNLPTTSNSITTFEINETTAKISKILNPNINVNLRSFETEFITENGQKKEFQEKYDLVIGNPPYGQHRGFYKGLGEEPKIARYEDYFIKRSLDVLRDGGTLAMVVPSSWLNRQKNFEGAELQEAYRLPNGIFKSTDIGTDIIILKKNNVRQQNISNYFRDNPNRILGELGQKTNRFGKLEEYVKGSLEEALSILEQSRAKHQKTQQQIQLNLFDKELIQNDPSEIEKNSTKELQKNIENTLVRLHNIKFKSLVIINEIEKYNGIYRELEDTPENFDTQKIKELSKNLDRLNKKIIKYDEEHTIQTSPEIKKGILKYHFQKKDEVVDSSLQNSSNLTKEQTEAFQQTEYDGTLLIHESKLEKYANYYKGVAIHDFYYAEGDIYEKLEQLEIEKETISEQQYQKQKALLESVLPKKKGLDDIIISPNHEFIHQFLLGTEERDFAVIKGYNSYTGRPQYSTEKKMVNVSLADRFQEFVRKLPREAFGQSNSWEVNAFVRNETVTGSDRERNAEVRERRKEVANDLFYKFIREELEDDLKERFINEFNRKYNNIYIPDYSQFPLFSKIHKNFKGNPLRLTEVQKAGVGRLTTKGVGLLAHEVGFGKTLSGVLAMHEAMERGNAKRPLIVVPNDSILKQWVETIFETIPEAKVNVLGNLGKNYDLSKFDNKDGEITLVTYEGFNNIGFSKEITEQLASKFNYISQNELKGVVNSERNFQKEIEKDKEIQGKMKRGKVYDWEDFAFDHLTFDEVHNANHIVGKVRIEDRRFASDFRNQNQRTSKLGLNAWVASQYIQEHNNGRNVTLLSATPFTNKPLEYYSILSLIANNRLEKSGYFNVNTFFETFMEADDEMEVDAKGDIKYKMNVRRFKNNALFQQLLGEFIDIKGEEDNPELKRPNRINKEYKIEQNSLTEKEYSNLNASFDESADGAILTHILNARLIALSPYLSKFYEGKKPTMEEFVENSPKLKTTIDLIAQNKKDKPEAGQIIYSELGISEFPKIKEYLIAKVGYKPNEVEMITGATSKNKRLEIQEKFNQGKIKIILGSEAIQEGMNLQINTSDMYLLTLPYNFTSLRQVEGRAWRQGNKWENVRINFMLTNDSIDVFMLQKLQAKQSRYMEAMKNGANIIDVSDVDTQELKTAIITDPELRAKIEIEVVKKKFESLKNRQSSELGYISRKFEKYTESEEFKKVQRLKNDIEQYTEWAKDDKYWADILKSAKANLANAEENLKELIDSLAKQGVNVEDFKEQQRMTEEKIAELDRVIQEDLPKMREELIKKYKEEKAEQLRKTSPLNFVEERAEENKTFFNLVSAEEKITEELKSSKSFKR
ncbi:Eco57I restriction-modification methylase domain-containing protein [Riemerella anatipestifer]|uniref:Eco57I restriction-modification methylase domain-containing protein n=1 Tax=Riemerella anatipestifer TaxID=34085 RepID=UPI00069B6A0F|nr:helicase-related protein [Riemerella anatipestifer]